MTILDFGFPGLLHNPQSPVHAKWDDFEGPLIYLNSPERCTVSIGLRMFQDTFGGDFEQLMAVTLVHIVPTILVFFAAQRYFVRGIATSGLGGR